MSTRTRAVGWTIPLFAGLLYALWPTIGLPVFYYLPETRHILWTPPEDVIAMGWYGRFLLSLLFGVLLGCSLAMAEPHLPRSWSRLGPWAAAVAVGIALAIIAAAELLHGLPHH
jgi:hypothetical protein